MTPRTPAELRTEIVPIDSVRPLKRNPRRGDVDRVRRSIRRWGQYVPIIVRAETDEIVKGNHTWQALKEEGHPTVAIVRRPIASDAEAEELAIADNVASDAAVWDAPLLSEILKGGQIDIDATLLDPVQVDAIHVEAAAIAASEAGRALGELQDVAVPDAPAKPTTRLGDVIRLGDHVLVCGDSSDAAVAAAALDAAGAETCDLIFSSPPYNVRVDYGDGHSDETLPWPEYRLFLEGVARAWLPRLGRGRLLCWNIGAAASVHPHRQAVMFEDLGLTFVRQLVWRKSGVPLPKWHVTARNPVARRFTPNPIHELVYVFSKGEISLGPPLPATDETAQHDVFTVNQSAATRDVPDDTTDGAKRTGARQSQGLKTRSRKKHPAPFPAALVAPFAVHLAAPGEIIADPFAGAGTVALVAEQRDRRAIMAELDPGFCDVAVERWEKLTGRKATRPRRRRRQKARTA